MADSKPQAAEVVPSWDGNPRGWRRYQREVVWYVLGTKKSQRSLIGPRLVSKLTGPARLLAMSWSKSDIAGPQGVQVMLRKLEQSPLVRKKLPNTAAVMQQYFNYRRNPLVSRSVPTWCARLSSMRSSSRPCKIYKMEEPAHHYLMIYLEMMRTKMMMMAKHLMAGLRRNLATLQFLNKILTILVTDLEVVDEELDELRD